MVVEMWGEVWGMESGSGDSEDRAALDLLEPE